MALLDYFRSKPEPSTAKMAKERLQIIVAHERGSSKTPDYLPQLKQDILEVLKKYVTVEADDVMVQLDKRSDQLSVLELNITLPEEKK